MILRDTSDTMPEPALDHALWAFGRHLAVLRRTRGWSQERLALESGLARSYLGGVERGQRNLSFKNLVRLAQTLELALPALVNFDLTTSTPGGGSDKDAGGRSQNSGLRKRTSPG